VYARGFGYANRERREPVQPDSLFRIASISKPLTAVATLQLIEQGKLKLDDRVFKLLPYKAHLPEGGKVDPRLNDITLAHLMRHQGGWAAGYARSVEGASFTLEHPAKLPATAGQQCGKACP